MPNSQYCEVACEKVAKAEAVLPPPEVDPPTPELVRRLEESKQKESAKSSSKKERIYTDIRPLGADDDVVLDSSNPNQSSTNHSGTSTGVRAVSESLPREESTQSNKQPAEKRASTPVSKKSSESERKIERRKRKERRKQKAEKLRKEREEKRAKYRRLQKYSTLIGLVIGFSAVFLIGIVVAIVFDALN